MHKIQILFIIIFVNCKLIGLMYKKKKMYEILNLKLIVCWPLKSKFICEKVVNHKDKEWKYLNVKWHPYQRSLKNSSLIFRFPERKWENIFTFFYLLWYDKFKVQCHFENKQTTELKSLFMWT